MALWMSLTTPFSSSGSAVSCAELAGGSAGAQPSGDARNRSRSSKELSRGVSGGSAGPGAPLSARGVLDRLWRSAAGPCSGTENMQCRLRDARSRRAPGSGGSEEPPASSDRKDRPEGEAGEASAGPRLTAG